MTWRAIHQSQLLDPRLYSAPAEIERLYVRLVCFSDSYGRLPGHPLTLQHMLTLIGWTPTDTADRLTMLHVSGLVDWYGTAPHDAVVQITGFDSTQKVRRLGSPQLPARTDEHHDGPILFRDLTTTTPGLLPDHSRTTPGLQRNIYRYKSPATNPVTGPKTRQDLPSDDGLLLVSDAWRQHTRRSRQLTPDETKRVLQVLQVHDAADVVAYLADAMRDPWYWKTGPTGRPLIHRRDVCCVFPIKGPLTWQRRLSNFMEPDQAGPAPSTPSLNYEPDDTTAAAADLAATLGGTL